jgi:putative metallohydrolase (TIGR04338 family)
MTLNSRDTHRSSVYSAEDQWSALLDRGGRVDFFGSTIDVPMQLRFGSLDDVITYATKVTSARGITPVEVRHRKGGTRAHYSNGVIAIPTNQSWAMRESVVLHEIAHHACVHTYDSALHDRYFTSTMLDLVETTLGSPVALLLRAGYQANLVPIAVTA